MGGAIVIIKINSDVSAGHAMSPAVAPRTTGSTASSVAPVLVTNEWKKEPVVHCTTGVMCGMSTVSTAKELVSTGSAGGATGTVGVLSVAPLPNMSTSR